MSGSASILLVEDDEDDYLITKDALEQSHVEDFDLVWVQDYASGLDHLTHNEVDVCLVDFRIGARTGLEFLKAAKDRGIRCPVILLTGVGQHDIDVAAAEAGAADFLDKSDLTPNLIERSIRYAIANANALDALAEQRSILKTTLEYSGAGVAALDNLGHLTASNKQFDDLLTDIVATNFSDAESARAKALESLVFWLAEKSGQELEFTNSNRRVFEIRKNRTPQGGTVIFAVDITDKKAFQSKLIRAKTEVEAASRAKSSFLANMSHEFRTPIHGIMGFSDLIMNRAESDEIKEFVQQISDSSAHLLEIINTVLAYSRLEAGQHPFESTELLDVYGLVRFCVKQVLTAAAEREIELVTEIDPQLHSLHCDTTSLRRILINLLSNAVRFSTQKGRVETKIAIEPDGRLNMTVKDYGIGMKPEEVHTAFLPFHQLSDGYDRQSGGTGLGLPMVKSLAELHNAEVAILTAPKKGTAVSVIFPVERVSLRQPSDVDLPSKVPTPIKVEA